MDNALRVLGPTNKSHKALGNQVLEFVINCYGEKIDALSTCMGRESKIMMAILSNCFSSLSIVLQRTCNIEMRKQEKVWEIMVKNFLDYVILKLPSKSISKAIFLFYFPRLSLKKN